MRTAIAFYLVFLCSVQSLAKRDTSAYAVLTGFCKELRYDSLDHRINTLIKANSANSRINYHHYLSRELVADFMEGLIEFEYGDYDYRVYLLHKNNVLCSYKITDFYYKTAGKSHERVEILIDEYTDTTMIAELKSAFVNTYENELDFTELHTTDITYGMHCGIAGIQPEYRTKLNALVAQKDLETLDKWLRSQIVEIQLYAIDGYLQLYEKDKTLPDPATISLVKLIADKKGVAHTCSGCFYDQEPISKIVSDMFDAYRY